MSPTDVVFVAVSDTYTDSVRRGFYSTADQFLLSLLASNDIGKVLVVDHPRGLASQIQRRSHGDSPAPRTSRLRGVRPLVLRTEPPTRWGDVVGRYRAYDRQIAIASRLKGLQDPVLVSFNASHVAAALPRWARSVWFYAQDDEQEIPRLAAVRDNTRRAYDAIASSSVKVVTVTHELARRVGAADAAVIPNGVDASLWSRVPVRKGTRSGPATAVYVGTIDQRLDIAGIRSVANAGYQVRMIGAQPDPAVSAELGSLAGVRLEPSVSRLDVVDALRDADVCILAHRKNPLTDAMSPLKLFEYLASGTPVVATALSGIEEQAGRALTVEPGGDYGVAAGRAIARGNISEAERRRVVDSLSWRARHSSIIAALTEK